MDITSEVDAEIRARVEAGTLAEPDDFGFLGHEIEQAQRQSDYWKDQLDDVTRLLTDVLHGFTTHDHARRDLRALEAKR